MIPLPIINCNYLSI